ncbi:hypothetical protein ACLMJK_008990 [Lecanora helva]
MSGTTPSPRPRAASQPFSPDENVPPSTTDSTIPNGSIRRKGSFSFLRRSKSRDRSTSGNHTPRRKLSKKERIRMREQEMMAEKIPPRPPRIPDVPHQPALHSFDGDEKPFDTAAVMSDRSIGSFQHRLAHKTSQEAVGADMHRGMRVPPVPPIPPMPGTVSASNPSYADNFSRTESMAHRGRYSYASSAISTINSPRKIRRRKDPTPFNILIIGARGSGKTSFLKFLQKTLELPAWKQRQQSRDDDLIIPSSASAFPTFTPHFIETDVGSEKIGVTLWDSEGLETNVVDIQIQKMVSFIESKFEDTFNEENQVARAPGFRDTHIHCVFLILDPTRLDANLAANQRVKDINGAKAKANSFAKGRPEPSPSGLDENFDLNILRSLKGKTTVVPVIAKADTITSAHMTYLKHAVWQSLRSNGLETLEAISQDEDEESDTDTENGGANPHSQLNGDTTNTSRDEDKFSVTSVLDSPSDTDSEFSASDFDLAKPGKPSKISSRTPSSPTVPAPLPTGPPPLPLSVISPDPYDPEVVGRKFPWGFANPMDAEHCDFTKLKETVFSEWKNDLREASREMWYEGWRTSRLNKKARRDGAFINDAITPAWAR